MPSTLPHSPRPQQVSHLNPSTSSALPFSRPQTPHGDITIGFAGLGAMGYLMARNLANRLLPPAISHPILIWNRTQEKAEKLALEVGQSKIKIAGNPEQLALECDVIISNLANDDVVRTIYEKFAAALQVRLLSMHKILARTYFWNNRRERRTSRTRSLSRLAPYTLPLQVRLSYLPRC